jgi:ABC-2 type transport system permease protein
MQHLTKYHPKLISALNPNLQPVVTLSNSKKSHNQEIYALTKRLVIQGWRRPSTLLTGIIQPLLWLILFSALFQNAPIDLVTSTEKYRDFISSGIVVFTAFTCSLNAGLPLMFDREFGFLNRLLSSPIYSRYSIIDSSSLYITLISSIQVNCIILISYIMGNSIPFIENGLLVFVTLLLIGNSVTSISLLLAFILPGHIELLACLLVINLPLLFSSTALAPLIFMPSWLQVIASLNPLSYTIEIIRYACLHDHCYYNFIAMQTVWGPISIIEIHAIMVIINGLCFISINNVITSKFEE